MKVPSPINSGDLVLQAQAGSEEAAQILFDRYRQPLLGVIRQLLSHPLRKLYDSEDFLLDTFAEIFSRNFTEEVLGSPQTFWPYLEKIAVSKVRDAQRKHLVTKRNLLQEVSLESMEEVESWSRDISAEEALLLKELVEERLAALVAQLPSMLQEMIQLLLQGHNRHEIAHLLNLEPKRVYRAMDWLKKKLQQ